MWFKCDIGWQLSKNIITVWNLHNSKIHSHRFVNNYIAQDSAQAEFWSIQLLWSYQHLWAKNEWKTYLLWHLSLYDINIKQKLGNLVNLGSWSLFKQVISIKKSSKNKENVSFDLENNILAALESAPLKNMHQYSINSILISHVWLIPLAQVLHLLMQIYGCIWKGIEWKAGSVGFKKLLGSPGITQIHYDGTRQG